jgi:hypothetical protein
MRTRRRNAFAASFVVTIAAASGVMAGCDDKPKYAPNPPAPTETPNPPAPPQSVDAGAASTDPPPAPTSDPIATAPTDGGRHIIANPPRIMDAPDGGFLDRRADGTCWWAETAPQPCPPPNQCKPSAPMRRVRCP